mmetsp:Transcript_16350/g.57139  ORF Transcript_16350/g.57139 Transcript_16350/m.57139 type:complete len:213 (-) Transcript_16350:633-1271(-)
MWSLYICPLRPWPENPPNHSKSYLRLSSMKASVTCSLGTPATGLSMTNRLSGWYTLILLFQVLLRCAAGRALTSAWTFATSALAQADKFGGACRSAGESFRRGGESSRFLFCCRGEGAALGLALELEAAVAAAGLNNLHFSLWIGKPHVQPGTGSWAFAALGGTYAATPADARKSGRGFLAGPRLAAALCLRSFCPICSTRSAWSATPTSSC